MRTISQITDKALANSVQLVSLSHTETSPRNTSPGY